MDMDLPGAEVWLGETSSCQCGGQPGISNAFVSGFYWLDELGQMARRGTKVVVRQSLTGADYGLLAEPSLEPTPDYFNTVLWRTLMGTKVLSATTPLSTLRAYAHCTAPGAPDARAGAVTVVLLNLDDAATQSVRFDGVAGSQLDLYLLTGALDSTTTSLNGETLAVAVDGSLPSFAPVATTGSVALPPRSYAFVVLPDAAAPACQN
jgi:hypothetical protein